MIRTRAVHRRLCESACALRRPRSRHLRAPRLVARLRPTRCTGAAVAFTAFDASTVETLCLVHRSSCVLKGIFASVEALCLVCIGIGVLLRSGLFLFVCRALHHTGCHGQPDLRAPAVHGRRVEHLLLLLVASAGCWLLLSAPCGLKRRTLAHVLREGPSLARLPVEDHTGRRAGSFQRDQGWHPRTRPLDAECPEPWLRPRSAIRCMPCPHTALTQMHPQQRHRDRQRP